MKEERVNSLKQLYYIIVGLIVVIAMLVGYIIWDNFNSGKIDGDNTSSNNNTSNQVENDTIEDETQNIESLVDELYNYYDMGAYQDDTTGIRMLNIEGSGFAFNYFKELYSNEKLLVNDNLHNDEKLDIALSKLPQDKVTKQENPGTEYNLTTRFAVSDLKDAYKKFFGYNEDAHFVEFNSIQSGNCEIEGESYICELGPAGGEASDQRVLTKYKGYDYEGNTINIYEYVAFAQGENYYRSYDWLKGSGGYLFNIPELNGKLEAEAFSSNNIDKLSIYKLTFVQNDLEQYYLYSIEPVK